MVNINGTTTGTYVKYVYVLREHHRTKMKLLLLKKSKRTETISYKKLGDYLIHLTSKKNNLEAMIQHFVEDGCVNNRLCEIDDILSKLSEDELLEGLLRKNEVYSLLKEKTNIMKKLDADKYKIGISLYFINKIDDSEIRTEIRKKIFSVEDENDVDDLHIENPWVDIIFGILKNNEENKTLEIISIGDEVLVVPKNEYREVEGLIKECPSVANKIQFKNAEKQVRGFESNEQKEFEELQAHYLELLSKLNEVKRKYSDYKIPEDDKSEG